MTNRSFIASARKSLLKRGRALLRSAQNAATSEGTSGPDYLTALSAAERDELEEIHAALERIECGRFGRCEICTTPILEETLASHPWRRSCATCSRTTASMSTNEAHPQPN